MTGLWEEGVGGRRIDGGDGKTVGGGEMEVGDTRVLKGACRRTTGGRRAGYRHLTYVNCCDKCVCMCVRERGGSVYVSFLLGGGRCWRISRGTKSCKQRQTVESERSMGEQIGR